MNLRRYIKKDGSEVIQELVEISNSGLKFSLEELSTLSLDYDSGLRREHRWIDLDIPTIYEERE